ncbi:hypothetical protein HanIR_Chr17g0878671 [Helianthus annuus]|nr:hypothetical protein HanIR_Chr17g0878671 [Helianthus annuus]
MNLLMIDELMIMMTSAGTFHSLTAVKECHITEFQNLIIVNYWMKISNLRSEIKGMLGMNLTAAHNVKSGIKKPSNVSREMSCLIYDQKVRIFFKIVVQLSMGPISAAD